MAVVAAGLAALLARGLMSPPAPAPVQQTVQAPTSDVLVASTDIDRGTRMSTGDFRWQSWPQSSLSPSFITRQMKPDAITELTGSLARVSIANGEPISDGKLVNMSKGGFMSALINPGMRAVAIPIAPETGAGGFILPNDHVDVILTRRVQQEGARGTQDAVRSDTILRDIRVLAIDQRFKDDSSDEVALGKTATLELTAPQAEMLTASQAEGTIALSLRGLAEPDQKTAEVGDKDTATIMRVIRYGAEKTVRVR
ncbi:MAG TPA: Flp pilus assembly protein CpaB [Parvibaculum sp.]